jgi:hypothetical protein
VAEENWRSLGELIDRVLADAEEPETTPERRERTR